MKITKSWATAKNCRHWYAPICFFLVIVTVCINVPFAVLFVAFTCGLLPMAADSLTTRVVMVFVIVNIVICDAICAVLCNLLSKFMRLDVIRGTESDHPTAFAVDCWQDNSLRRRFAETIIPPKKTCIVGIELTFGELRHILRQIEKQKAVEYTFPKSYFLADDENRFTPKVAKITVLRLLKFPVSETEGKTVMLFYELSARKSDAILVKGCIAKLERRPKHDEAIIRSELDTTHAECHTKHHN